jgi:hypothetical protein
MAGQVKWLAAALLGFLPSAVQAASPQQAGVSPARVIDDSDRVILKRNVPRLARPQFDKGRSDPSLPMDRMILTLSLRPGAQQELDEFLARQLDPKSSDYHRWLTPEEFGARFGATDEDIQLVTGWLEGHGFRVDEVAKGRGWINFSGTANQTEAAFATEMHDYQVGGKIHHANAIDPSIPRALSSIVKGVVSLNNFPKRHPQTGRFKPVSSQGPTPNFTCSPQSSPACTSGLHFVGPADFATIYNVDPVYGSGIDGTGTTIAIVGRTDISLSDVQAFRSHFGLPAKDPVFIHNGTPPGNLGDGEEVEANLDVQWSGAVAKRATIKFVISKTTNTTDGVDLSAQYIVNNNLADTMSTSFGLCEALMTSTELAFFNNLWGQAAAQGITSFVSSGDSGGAGCDDPGSSIGTGRAVSGLCSTPNNVCVGGSQFDDTGSPGSFWSSSNDPITQASALSYIPEIAWNESGNVAGGSKLWSSGGGPSAVYSKPSWQSAPGVPADGKRDIPDVSLTAAGHDGYLIHVVDQTPAGWGAVGGTSASSPSFAGLMALVVQQTGQRQGNANGNFYAMGTNQYAGGGPAVFHDVTVGNNSVPGVSGFACTFGYDRVTGLGTVDADALVAAFANLPTLSVGDVTLAEGDSGTTNAGFSVTLSSASTGSVTVQYTTADGTAKAGSDYVATSGTLTFTPGQTAKTVNVPVNGDLLFEADETFFLNLSNPSGALIADGQGKGTIQNDDAPPSVSIDDVSAPEGNSGTKNFAFTVTLSTGSGAATLVPYSTADGTATASSGDYIAAAGTLTIPAGAPSGKINVAVKGDAVIEPDETFFVNLGTPTNATIADGQGQGTIKNDDAPGTFSFSLANYTVSEASSLATIKVTRTGGNAAGAMVDYAVTPGTATIGADYSSPPGTTLTFGANQLSATFTVPIVKDTIDEPNETVLLRLSNPQPAAEHAALGAQSTAVLTITDNDTPGKVQFSLSQYKAVEGGPAAVITVKRLGGLASGVTVNYAASAGTAVDGGDFTATSGTLTFGTSGIGATTQTFQVTIGPDDHISEGARTVQLTLSAPGGGAVLGTPSSAVLTIADAESTVEFSSTAFSVKESAASALVTVKRWGPLTGTATVDYATSDGSATATGLTPDYKSASGTLTFLPGAATKTFTVPILKDSLVEGPETVNLTLSSPVGTSLGAANPAVLTITDDDVLPAVQFSAPLYTVSEASPKAVITVKRTGNLAGTVEVPYATADGTAMVSTGDYLAASGTLTFGPGKSLLTFPLTILPDTIDEGTETVQLTLSTPIWTNPGTPTIGGTNPATLLITDNEPTVQFTSAKFTASEALLKTNLVVRRTGSLTASATVDYALVGGTATNGSDYVLPVSGTLTFNPGAATVLRPVTLIPDKIDEPNETVIVTLSNPSAGLGLGTPEITTLTITDNDTAGKVQFGAANYSVDEGGVSVNLTVTRTLATSELATVDYQVTGGTATNGADYTLAPGTLTFNPGEKTKTIPIPIVDDALAEGNESVVVTLGTPSGGLSLGTLSQTTLWIVDND